MSHVSVGEETLVQTKRGKASDPQFPRRSGLAIVHPQFLELSQLIMDSYRGYNLFP